MTEPILIALTVLLVLLSLGNAFAFWLHYRRALVEEYRLQWRNRLQGDTEALHIFLTRVASFRKMLWSFKPLTDQQWIPPEYAALGAVAELNPETKKALFYWLKQREHLYPNKAQYLAMLQSVAEQAGIELEQPEETEPG